VKVEAQPLTEAECRALIDSLGQMVNDFLSTAIPDDGATPDTLVSAMRYSLNAGGKRLRPVLTLATYRALGGDPADILRPACALELIHTYSLIHDDLPCMDDDDFRRGQPTLHKKYNEAIAVLTGDALHALAFELLASAGNSDIVLEVSRAIGISGMLGGQVADVEAEGQDIGLDQIEYIHRNKTGALIRVAMRIGAILADADDNTLGIVSSYGSKIGLAFQIVDDVLDVTGSQEKLGKDIGSDEKNVKATYPRVIGLEESRQTASRLIAGAKREIDKIGQGSAVFKYLADFILKRET
jgi:geranylgeranyl diphosphate synthase type II